MKKWAYVLLGVVLAAFALTAVFHGVLGVAVGVAVGALSWRAFKAAGQNAPTRTPEAPRPWER